jgi:Omp85 superfamily domain
MTREPGHVSSLSRRSVRLLRASSLVLALLAAMPPPAASQPVDTREAEIAQAKLEKAKNLQPFKPNKAEAYLDRAEDLLLSGQLRWHPYFENAYSGGGFTMGAGYRRFVNAYDTIDLRGSITFTGYKRIEAEYLAPRLFDRRGVLSVIGGWREATQVGFYGIGTAQTSHDGRVNYSFQQPYGSARLDLWPTRRVFVLGAGFEVSNWDQGAGGGSAPSVEERYDATTLPGLGASPTYLHTQGSIGLDWRTSPGYSRRGGAYSVTLHDYADTDDAFGFQRVDYDVIQHLPILRDAWVLSLHGRVETTTRRDDQQIPFFMLPALGGGSTLRGFSSWRFRDRHSLLLQAEWRVLANRFLDMAVFYDAGKVTSRRGDLDLDGLKSDYGLGFRLHGPLATPLRIELAKSNEGLALVFSAKAAF